jgi:hypothetical protein
MIESGTISLAAAPPEGGLSLNSSVCVDLCAHCAETPKRGRKLTGNLLELVIDLKLCLVFAETVRRFERNKSENSERARQRGFLGDDLEARSSFEACDFFREVPPGCRAYMMKSVIHDWDDEASMTILANCRRVVPDDGALLLVEYPISEDNLPSTGKLADIIMMVLTGGRERTIEQYRVLLATAGFRLNQVCPTSGDFVIIEAMPA